MDASRFPTLDPQLATLVEVLPDMTGGLTDVAASRELMRSFLPTGPSQYDAGLHIADSQTSGGVGIRTYRPKTAAGTLPGLLYLHGGGFCLGDLDTEHTGAAQLSHGLGTFVVSVDYRLAPEDPYPAGLEDCYAGLLHLAALDDVDAARLVVHGQSAGGAMAAGVALLARDRGGPAISLQSLGIPVLDDRLETPSMQAFVDTPMWSRPQAEASWRHYLAGRPADGYAAPARTEDLTGLPPAYITTMELDPLRDEGIGYALRLLAAGVSVELHSYPGTFHGSAVAVDADVSKRATRDLIEALARALR